MKKILITGGAGFVGSNLAIRLSNEGYPVVVFDNLKRRGSEFNLRKLLDCGIEFIHGDIRNEEDFEGVENIEVVIDASAEPSVVSGLNGGSKQLININLVGTLNILNLALKHNAQFIFLSTSRIYPIEPLNQVKVVERTTRFDINEEQNLEGITRRGIAENFTLNGYRSLYGASKLASELLIHEYNHFYNLKTVINRCGVIAGPYQMGKIDQGVTVLWVARHFWKKQLSYFGFGGTGKQVRDVLHIKDLEQLIIKQIEQPELFNNGLFNVGGGLESSYSLLELTKYCQQITGNKIEVGSVLEDRVADIKLYITDNKKVTDLCDWKPQNGVYEIVKDIYSWIKQDEKNIYNILNKQ